MIVRIYIYYYYFKWREHNIASYKSYAGEEKNPNEITFCLFKIKTFNFFDNILERKNILAPIWKLIKLPPNGINMIIIIIDYIQSWDYGLYVYLCR